MTGEMSGMGSMLGGDGGVGGCGYKVMVDGHTWSGVERVAWVEWSW